MELTYSVKLDSGAKYITRADDDLHLKIGDTCIIRKDFYQDYATIVQVRGEFKEDDYKEDIPKVIRKANFHDKSKAHENIMRAKSAFRTTEKFVEQLSLPMRLLNAHYTFDKKLITIQFTAEGRVDFRELVKQLTQALNTRVELRQIGVRDETAIIGGLGVCGQELCCSRYLKSFASINVKMAKDQDLSLNPSSISGVCGRLKCCLKYEHEGYKYLDKQMPRRGERCETPDGDGKVIDRNLLSQVVVVRLQDTGSQKSFHKDEIGYGKQKMKVVEETVEEQAFIPKKQQAEQGNGRNNDKPQNPNNKNSNVQQNQGKNKQKNKSRQNHKNHQNKKNGNSRQQPGDNSQKGDGKINNNKNRNKSRNRNKNKKQQEQNNAKQTK